MNATERSGKQPAGLVYRNAALTVIAGILGVIAMRGLDGAPGTAEAAGNRNTGGVVNPADQRQEMILELRRVSEKLDALNKTLAKPIKAEIVSMPDGESERD